MKIPEPIAAQEIKIDPSIAYVLRYKEHLPAEAQQRIIAEWMEILGPNAPKLIVLDRSMELARLDSPSQLNITVEVMGVIDYSKANLEKLAGQIKQSFVPNYVNT